MAESVSPNAKRALEREKRATETAAVAATPVPISERLLRLSEKLIDKVQTHVVRDESSDTQYFKVTDGAPLLVSENEYRLQAAAKFAELAVVRRQNEDVHDHHMAQVLANSPTVSQVPRAN